MAFLKMSKDESKIRVSTEKKIVDDVDGAWKQTRGEKISKITGQRKKRSEDARRNDSNRLRSESPISYWAGA